MWQMRSTKPHRKPERINHDKLSIENHAGSIVREPMKGGKGKKRNNSYSKPIEHMQDKKRLHFCHKLSSK